jgi:C1A family cysteine protease
MDMAKSFLPISPGGRRYGRYPDNQYHPARKLLRLARDPAVVLPPSASVVQWMGPIRDQGQEGSCSGQMKAEYRDWLYRAFYQYEKDQSVPPDQFKASAAFAYQTNLIADGDLGTDAGSTIHQSFITLNQKGCCLESQEPYTQQDYMTAPTDAEYAEGLVYKGGPYHFLPDLPTMKACIAGIPGQALSGYPFGFGILVYDSFEGDQLAQTGFMPLPDVNNEKLQGGHAQFALAYDDNIQFPDGSQGGVFVQNSWGSAWGISASGRSDGGCYWMPYAFFSMQDPNGNGPCVNDAWMMHLGPAWKT